MHKIELVWGRNVNATNFLVSGCLRQVSVGRNPESNIPFICINPYEWQLLIECISGLINRECHELIKSILQLLGSSSSPVKKSFQVNHTLG